MRILLGDSRATVRSAVQLVLQQEANTEIVGEATNGSDLLLRVEDRSPDLLVLDWDLPGPPIATLLAALRSVRPNLKVIVLSVRPEARSEAAALGVEWFVSKNAPAEDLLAAVDGMRSRYFTAKDTPIPWERGGNPDSGEGMQI